MHKISIGVVCLEYLVCVAARNSLCTSSKNVDIHNRDHNCTGSRILDSRAQCPVGRCSTSSPVLRRGSSDAEVLKGSAQLEGLMLSRMKRLEILSTCVATV